MNQAAVCFLDLISKSEKSYEIFIQNFVPSML